MSFMLFEAAHYHCNKWHQLLRSNMVEDIHIMQYSKKGGYRNHCLLSGGQIRCRMYSGAAEAIHGFAKNVLAFFGNSIPFALFHVLATTVGILPFLFLPIPFMAAWLVLVLGIRIATSAASRQNPILNLLLMPLQQVVLVFFFFKAVLLRSGKAYHWKGRPVQN
jgi:chlorobactene glucosyltransferase